MGPDALATLAQDQRLSLVVAGLRSALARDARATRPHGSALGPRPRAVLVPSLRVGVHRRERSPGGTRWRRCAAGVARSGRSARRLARGHGAPSARGRSRQGRLSVALAALRAAAGASTTSSGAAMPRAAASCVGCSIGSTQSAGAFDSSHSTQPGFETLVRSLPIDGDPPRPQLPGGPGSVVGRDRGRGAAGHARGAPGRRAESSGRRRRRSGALPARADQPGRSARARSQRPAPTAPRRQSLLAASGDLFARERRPGDARERHVRSRVERPRHHGPALARGRARLSAHRRATSASRRRLAPGTARDRVPGRRRVAALDGRRRPRRRRRARARARRLERDPLASRHGGGGGSGRAGVDRPPPARAAAGAGGRARPRSARARHAPGPGRFHRAAASVDGPRLRLGSISTSRRRDGRDARVLRSAGGRSAGGSPRRARRARAPLPRRGPRRRQARGRGAARPRSRVCRGRRDRRRAPPPTPSAASTTRGATWSRRSPTRCSGASQAPRDSRGSSRASRKRRARSRAI